MSKTYNTPKRSHIVKTRLDDEEHADFLHQVEIYGMNQSEFIREAISGATIRPVIVASNVNDALSTISKMPALPIVSIKRVGSTVPENWMTPIMPPTPSLRIFVRN